MYKGTHFYDVDHECSTVVEPTFDKSGVLQSSKFIVDHLKRHIIPIVNGNRKYDSAVFDYDSFTLTDEDIKKCISKFSRNKGTMCDGKQLSIIDKSYYFKFTTNVTITMDAGKQRLGDQKLFSLVDLYDRSIKQLPTLSLYINGYKIPDSLIKVYMSDTCTDILIPMSYLTENDDGSYESMEICVQKRLYQKYHYYTKYYQNIPGKQLIIDLSDSKLNKCNLNFVYKFVDGKITSIINSCKNLMIYVNGIYKQPSTYSMSITNNELIVDLNSSGVSVSDSCEVVIDSDIKTINVVSIPGDYSTTAAQLIRCYFNIPESSSEYKRNFIYGSLPKENCYFFVNNKYVSLNKIKQVGRLNYIYENYETPHAPYTCTVIYTDKDIYDESKSYIYGEDYYLSNFYGIDKISSILNKLQNNKKLVETDSFINKYLLSDKIDYKEIMYKNGKMYSNEYANYLNNLNNVYTDFNSLTRQLIKESGNYLIRDFMNLFGKDDIFIEVYKDENTPETLSYSFKTRVDLLDKTTQFYYMVDINGSCIPTDNFSVKEDKQYNYIKIPSSLLVDGLNKIHIRQNKYNNGTTSSIEFKSVAPGEFKKVLNTSDDDITVEEYNTLIDDITSKITETNNDETITSEEKEEKINEYNILLNTYKNAKIGSYKYYYKFNTFKSVMNLSDYLCLKYVYNDDKYYYSAETENHGWIVNKNAEFIENIDGSITLLVSDIDQYNYMIYSKRFAFKFHTVIEKDLENIEDMSINVKGNDSYLLPIIPNGSYNVFLNGEKLYNGIDYVFRHPGNYNLITYSSLCLKRKTKKNDQVDIYFDNVQNITVGHSSDILSHSGVVWNKYGLIYFGSLSYPYSPKYIDLYINGKYIYPDQIDILSDKLIRVDCEIENPMYDIFAETTFSVDIDKLKYYFDYEGNEYNDSNFEKLIAELFSEYDFSTITNPAEETTANDVYASFDDDVDSWSHMINSRRAEDSDEALEIAEDLVSRRYDLYENAYLLWLKSNSVKTIMKPGENINQEILNYFKFYLEDTELYDRQDVVVSAQTTKTFNDIVFGHDKYPFDHTERVMRYLKFAKGNNIGVKTAYDKLKDHYPISNAMYPRDFPKVIGSRTLIAQTNRDIVIGGVTGPIYSERTTDNE